MLEIWLTQVIIFTHCRSRGKNNNKRGEEIKNYIANRSKQIWLKITKLNFGYQQPLIIYVVHTAPLRTIIFTPANFVWVFKCFIASESLPTASYILGHFVVNDDWKLHSISFFSFFLFFMYCNCAMKFQSSSKSSRDLSFPVAI